MNGLKKDYSCTRAITEANYSSYCYAFILDIYIFIYVELAGYAIPIIQIPMQK